MFWRAMVLHAASAKQVICENTWISDQLYENSDANNKAKNMQPCI